MYVSAHPDDQPGSDLPSHLIPKDSEKWKELTDAFVGANTSSIVMKLKGRDNEPLLIEKNSWIDKRIVGGMNSVLMRKGSDLRLVTIYAKLPWSEQAIRFEATKS